MAVYPPTLPDLLLGLRVREKPQTIRTAMDVGPDKVRRITQFRSHTLDGPVVFTGANIAVFETFFYDTLDGGSLPFDWEDPRDDSTVSYRYLETPQWRLIDGDGDPDHRQFTANFLLEKV